MNNTQDINYSGINQQEGPLFTSTTEEKVVIPVIEEKIKVHTEIVETGKVSISKKINEYQETVNIPIIQEEVNIDRVQVNKMVEFVPAVRYEGDTMIIPVVKEVAVVEKRLMLVEELHITIYKREIPISQEVTLRKEEINVRNIPNENSQSNSL